MGSSPDIVILMEKGKMEQGTILKDREDFRLRIRNGDLSPQMHFLNARIVGAPEVIFRLFGYEMKHGRAVTHLCTRPPGARRRAMARLNLNAQDADAFNLRFFDGTLEQYARRPKGVVDGVDFGAMLYPEFHRAFEVKKWRDMTAGQRDRSNVEMRCIALPGEDEGAMLVDDALAGGPHEHSKWVVARESVRPVWYDWMLPSKHGTLYFYQRLLLRTPWRDSTPESQLIIAQLQRCSTLSPTARHLI